MTATTEGQKMSIDIEILLSCQAAENEDGSIYHRPSATSILDIWKVEGGYLSLSGYVGINAKGI
jgi:hypothetical protein